MAANIARKLSERCRGACDPTAARAAGHRARRGPQAGQMPPAGSSGRGPAHRARAPATGSPRAANGWAREGPHRDMSEHGSRNGRLGCGSRDGTTSRSVRVSELRSPPSATSPAAGLPARRRARSRPRGSNQLVITSHLPIDLLEPHRHLTVERIPIHITLHRGRLTLAMTLHDQVILRDTRIRQHLGHRLRATP